MEKTYTGDQRYCKYHNICPRNKVRNNSTQYQTTNMRTFVS